MVKLHTDLRRSVGFLAAKMTKTPHSAESIFPSLLGPGGENDLFLIISHQVPGNSVYFEHQNCDKHPEFWIQLAKGTPQYILHIYYYYFTYYIYYYYIYYYYILYIYIFPFWIPQVVDFPFEKNIGSSAPRRSPGISFLNFWSCDKMAESKSMVVSSGGWAG